MILEYKKGIKMRQIDIYNDPAFPKQNISKVDDIWGDPDIGYVGDLDGTYNNGYGVHWGPISNYLASKGVSNRVQRNIDVSQLAKEIEQGRPAIVWVWNGTTGGEKMEWKTPEGKIVKTIQGMHSWVVIGYVGTANNPVSIIVNDPAVGKRTLDVNKFKNQWSYFSNTAIIVD